VPNSQTIISHLHVSITEVHPAMGSVNPETRLQGFRQVQIYGLKAVYEN
jgi:hypothetical protein